MCCPHKTEMVKTAVAVACWMTALSAPAQGRMAMVIVKNPTCQVSGFAWVRVRAAARMEPIGRTEISIFWSKKSERTHVTLFNFATSTQHLFHRTSRASRFTPCPSPSLAFSVPTFLPRTRQAVSTYKCFTCQFHSMSDFSLLRSTGR